MEKRGYNLRTKVDWYNEASNLPPLHNQKHPITKKYWNDFKGIWCSKKSKKNIASTSSVALYDFYYYPIATIKQTFGSSLCERVALFLTKQYQKQLSGYSYDQWDFVYWSFHHLELYLGYKWPSIIDQLEAHKCLEVKKYASIYNTNKQCTYVKLNPAYASIQPAFKKTKFKDDKLQSSIIKHYKSLLKDRKGIIKDIEQTLDRTELKIEDPSALLNSIWERKLDDLKRAPNNSYASQKEISASVKALNDIQNAQQQYFSSLQRYYNYLTNALKMIGVERKVQYNIQKSSFGDRISHIFSNTPREMRKFITIDNEPVVEVDITASQPTFLYVIFLKWYKSKYKALAHPPTYFTEIYKAMNNADFDFYRFMVFKLKGVAHVKDKHGRDEMKTLFYRLVFGNPQYKLKSIVREEIVTKAFGYDFYQFLLDLSTKDLNIDAVNKPHKNLSHLLQTEEASFLLSVMKQMSKQKVPFLPLYDSLIVKRVDQQKASAAFADVAAKRGLKGIIKTK